MKAFLIMILKQTFASLLLIYVMIFQSTGQAFSNTVTPGAAEVKISEHDLRVRFTDSKMLSPTLVGMPVLPLKNATQLVNWTSTVFVEERYVIDNPTSQTIKLTGSHSPVAEASVLASDFSYYPDDVNTFVSSGANSFQRLRMNVQGKNITSSMQWRGVQTKTAGTNIEFYN